MEKDNVCIYNHYFIFHQQLKLVSALALSGTGVGPDSALFSVTKTSAVTLSSSNGV